VAARVREHVAQGPPSGLAAIPPRRVLGGAAWKFEVRCFGRGQRNFGLSYGGAVLMFEEKCSRTRAKEFRIMLWRRGKSPRRWKSRRAGGRALRYKQPPAPSRLTTGGCRWG